MRQSNDILITGDLILEHLGSFCHDPCARARHPAFCGLSSGTRCAQAVPVHRRGQSGRLCASEGASESPGADLRLGALEKAWQKTAEPAPGSSKL